MSIERRNAIVNPDAVFLTQSDNKKSVYLVMGKGRCRANRSLKKTGALTGEISAIC